MDSVEKETSETIMRSDLYYAIQSKKKMDELLEELKPI